MSNAPQLPQRLFFATPEDRAALARERFFDAGERPSGLVPEPVIQSWTRCVGAARRPDEAIGFDPISKSRVATVLARHRRLVEAARGTLDELEAALARSPVIAMLTSSEGVVVHASRPQATDSRLLQTVARVGVDIGEASVGTGAPGVAAKTGEAVMVRGAEHFFRCMAALHCAAAPIRDASGRVVAVLDLSCEHAPFRFDAGVMVQTYAAAIENRLLAGSARGQLLLRFHVSPGLFHTPLEGLAAVDAAGVVRWFNRAGASLLGVDRHAPGPWRADELFGLDVEALLARAHRGRPQPQGLPSGLTLWLEVQHDGRPAVPDEAPAEAPPAPEPTLLGDVHRIAIERALQQCGGNISKAARQLGVSRGLLYRRLREWEGPPAERVAP